jgi:hypothetical protein
VFWQDLFNEGNIEDEDVINVDVLAEHLGYLH